MNRREFTRRLASIGLAPALPMASVAPTAAASATADKMYFVSWYTARINKTCSPQMLARELNMSRSVAREVFDRLVQTKTVSLPDAFGVSRTLEPLSDSYLSAARAVAQQVAPPKPKGAAKDRLKRVKDAIGDLLEDDAQGEDPQAAPADEADVTEVAADVAVDPALGVPENQNPES